MTAWFMPGMALNCRTDCAFTVIMNFPYRPMAALPIVEAAVSGAFPQPALATTAPPPPAPPLAPEAPACGAPPSAELRPAVPPDPVLVPPIEVCPPTESPPVATEPPVEPVVTPPEPISDPPVPVVVPPPVAPVVAPPEPVAPPDPEPVLPPECTSPPTLELEEEQDPRPNAPTRATRATNRDRIGFLLKYTSDRAPPYGLSRRDHPCRGTDPKRARTNGTLVSHHLRNRHPSLQTRERAREESLLPGRGARHPEGVLVHAHHVHEAHEHLVVGRSHPERDRVLPGWVGGRSQVIDEASALEAHARSAGHDIRNVRVTVHAANAQLGGPQE